MSILSTFEGAHFGPGFWLQIAGRSLVIDSREDVFRQQAISDLGQLARIVLRKLLKHLFAARLPDFNQIGLNSDLRDRADNGRPAGFGRWRLASVKRQKYRSDRKSGLNPALC